MGKPKRPKEPMERKESIRDALARELREDPLTSRELSTRVRIPEKDVAEHLEHLSRSLLAHGERLHVEPASCLGCGFTFVRREKLTRPSRCPECSAERIEPPSFRVSKAEG